MLKLRRSPRWEERDFSFASTPLKITGSTLRSEKLRRSDVKDKEEEQKNMAVPVKWSSPQ
jgi:hypothetical protein